MSDIRLLTETLIKAGKHLSHQHLSEFFQAILVASVFVPEKNKKTDQNHIPAIGNKSLDELSYFFVHEESRNLLPIFSEESFLLDWADREIEISEKKLLSIIWELPPDTWLYLNPKQDLGKEFSPLELEMIKTGTDALEDFIAINQEEETSDFEIELPSDDLLKIQPKLSPIFETYQEVEEAYLLTIKEAESDQPRALVGIKYNQALDSNKLIKIREEIEDTAKHLLLSPFTGIFIVDDLANTNSPNQTLFLDFNPFYQRANK